MPTLTIDFKLDAILARITRIEKRMINLSPLVAQVDATVATMADAVEVIRVHVAELAKAREVDADSAVIDEIIAKLKSKTDELRVSLQSAARPVAPVADHPVDTQ
jgi:chromosome segregation ATPase